MKNLVVVAALMLSSVNAFAGDSVILKGPISLNNCYGKAYVFYAPKSDVLSVYLKDINAMMCNTISFFDQSNRRISDLTTIQYENYNPTTTKNFVLPEDVEEALIRDCKVVAKIGNRMFFESSMNTDMLLTLIPIELPAQDCHKTSNDGSKKKKVKGT